MNLLDILIIIFLFLGIIKGYRRGFLTGVFAFFGNIFSLLAAFFNYSRLADFLEGEFGVRGFLYGKLGALDNFMPEFIRIAPFDSSGLDSFMVLLGKSRVPGVVRDSFLAQAESITAFSEAAGFATMGEFLVYLAAVVVLNIICFFLIWFLVYHLILYVSGKASKGLDDSLWGALNRSAGVAVNLFLRCFVTAVFVFILSSTSGLGVSLKMDWAFSLQNWLQHSLLAPYFSLFADSIIIYVLNILS